MVVVRHSGLWPQYYILTLQSMFKSTSSDYRVDKRAPSECWISANNHYLDYPFHIPVISWIEKKTVTAMVVVVIRGGPYGKNPRQPFHEVAARLLYSRNVAVAEYTRRRCEKSPCNFFTKLLQCPQVTIC